MNFYIGNSIEKLKIDEKNVELDDDMLEYLYSIKKIIPNVTLFSIDQYSDTIIEKEDIIDIVSMCEFVLNEHVLNDYDESDDLICAIRELYKMCKMAIKRCDKIIVIGD